MKRPARSAILTVIPALLATASAALAQPSPAPAALPDVDPAIWVVKDSDTTVYLFGTFHLLDGKQDWFNDEVKTAFDASDEVILEIITPDDPSAMQQAFAKYAIDTSNGPLSARLSPKARERFAAEVAKIGAPPGAFDNLKPNFAVLILVVSQAQKLGVDQAKGVEAVLKAAARQSGKTLDDLETADQQLAMFANLPDATQLKSLETTLEKLDQFPGEFERMKGAWNKGDVETLAKMVQEGDGGDPVAYKAIFADRNANWAKWIDDRLDKPGTVFLAVGAGHLAGKSSVQDLLAKRGIQTQRLK
jgi:hypothetical protein